MKASLIQDKIEFVLISCLVSIVVLGIEKEMCEQMGQPVLF